MFIETGVYCILFSRKMGLDKIMSEFLYLMPVDNLPSVGIVFGYGVVTNVVKTLGKQLLVSVLIP
jgi:hypothetical protein